MKKIFLDLNTNCDAIISVSNSDDTNSEENLKLEQQHNHFTSATFPLNFLLEKAQKISYNINKSNNNGQYNFEESRPCSSLSVTETCSKNDSAKKQFEDTNENIEDMENSTNRPRSSDSVN